MSLPFGRAAFQRLRTLRPRGGHSKGGFLDNGHHEPGGNIFGETPPAPGETRKWESWEATWYLTLGAATAILYVGLKARPDTSYYTATDREAKRRLEA